jgi:plasmid maintenance system antidote protein VapI
MTAKLVYEVLEEELGCRGWSLADMAVRMGGDSKQNLCCLEIMSLGDNRVRLGLKTATQIGRAFGTSAGLWMALATAGPTADEQPDDDNF